MSENEQTTAIAINPPRLPYHPLIEERFGVDRSSWKALVEAIFPNASSVESVILALSYCRARKLDPFKRNVHIVAIWDKNRKCMVDSVWPGIGELRTTAFRTGEYAGRDDAVFGPTITARVGEAEISYPEWCRVTLYRIIKGERRSFAGPKVYWLETYATAKRDTDTPNEMWATRVFGQIEKCAEAAALRAAFPEEIGSEMIGDEVRGSVASVISRPAMESGSISDAVRSLPDAPQTPSDAPERGNDAQDDAGGYRDPEPGSQGDQSDPDAAAKEAWEKWLVTAGELSDSPAHTAAIAKGIDKKLKKLGIQATPWKLSEGDRRDTLKAIQKKEGYFAVA